VTCTPAGFERFVAEVAAGPVTDRAEVAAISASHGLEILGPPGALPNRGGGSGLGHCIVIHDDPAEAVANLRRREVAAIGPAAAVRRS
jgi:hypothetical protein